MFANHFVDKEEYKEKEFTQQTIYLVLLNVNTRYLIVKPVENKEIVNYINVIKDLIKDDVKVKNTYRFVTIDKRGRQHPSRKEYTRYNNNSMIQTLKGDGEFDTNDFYQFCNDYQIKLVIDDSPYTLAHKSIDSVMRTLRNAFGLNDNRIADNELMQQMVDYYNNTPHRSLRFPCLERFSESRDSLESKEDTVKKTIPEGIARQSRWIYYTPNELQGNRELEWQYIRMMMNRLRDISKQQDYKGLLTYKSGNIILVHLDKGKTEKKHEKQRRVFNDIAEFKCYYKGNVVCRLLKPYTELIKYVNDNTYKRTEFVRESNSNAYEIPKDYIKVPIIFCKFVSKDYESIPVDYKKYFDLI